MRTLIVLASFLVFLGDAQASQVQWDFPPRLVITYDWWINQPLATHPKKPRGGRRKMANVLDAGK